ncbi:MAG: hypothetical protein LUG60_01530 [Erysipelotrichaceae bacterium]|nr:hypothetical protein [Erysipelotrichaceae bacterium]
MIDNDNLKKCEKTIQNTWNDFRSELANGLFTYKDIDKALECTFLSTFDILFQKQENIQYLTNTIDELIIKNVKTGRGANLKKDEKLNYERFIPNKKYINDHNRFSPPGVEWLYLAIGKEDEIQQCAELNAELKSEKDLVFCHFLLNNEYSSCKLLDLTLSDQITYKNIAYILLMHECFNDLPEDRCVEELFIYI